jgi:hypothetical protein
MSTSMTKYAGTAPSSGGGGSGGAATGTATPQPLGTATAGTAVAASHEDHVHAMPTAAQVGAVALTDKGVANGVASLDGTGKIPTAQLPGSIAGALTYQGTWNATTNSPSIPAAASGNKGYYYKVGTAGSTLIDGTTDWQVGDWIVSNGTTWDKIDNTEADATSSSNGNVRLAGALGGTAAAPTALGLADAAALTALLATKQDKLPTVKNISAATYTVIDADAGQLLRFTNTGGCVVTIPVSLAANFRCDWYQSVGMTGSLQFQNDGTSAVTSIDGQLTAAGPKSVGSIFWTQANSYTVAGQVGTLTSSAMSDFVEAAQDAIAALLAAGTHTGISFAYDDANNKLSATVTGGGGGGSPPPSFSETGSWRIYPGGFGSGTTWANTGGVSNLNVLGTATSRGLTAFTTDRPYIHRLGHVAALGSNLNAGYYHGSAVGVVPGAGLGETYRQRMQFGFTDTIASGARGAHVIGQCLNGSSPSTTAEPSTTIQNAVGIIYDSTDSTFRWFSRLSGTAYKSAPLGSDFAPTAGYWFELDFKFSAGVGDARRVDMTLRNTITGASTSISLTPGGSGGTTAVGTQLPTAGQLIYPLCYRNSGSTDANVVAGTIGASMEVGVQNGGGFSGIA